MDSAKTLTFELPQVVSKGSLGDVSPKKNDISFGILGRERMSNQIKVSIIKGPREESIEEFDAPQPTKKVRIKEREQHYQHTEGRLWTLPEDDDLAIQRSLISQND